MRKSLRFQYSVQDKVNMGQIKGDAGLSESQFLCYSLGRNIKQVIYQKKGLMFAQNNQ